jgi:glucose-6-phosphate dehydrogenase assembly protein OpcA
MALNYKVLGQSAPSATTNTTLYTVPAQKEAVVSSITIVNRGSVAGTYRIAVRPNGATIANQHYIAFDNAIDAKATETLAIGITLDAADVISVYGSSGDFTFNAFGVEIQ